MGTETEAVTGVVYVILVAGARKEKCSALSFGQTISAELRELTAANIHD
jgi:hypothetical protein